LLALAFGTVLVGVGVAQEKRPGRLDVSGGTIAVRYTRWDPGKRSNWHIHPSGQLILPEEGRGLTQIEGGKVRELLPGVPEYVAPGAMHWHGAAPDQGALLLMVFKQASPEYDAKQIRPVTDEEYLAK
jgi:quercetin dioxygenase-like cupin family protein